MIIFSNFRTGSAWLNYSLALNDRLQVKQWRPTFKLCRLRTTHPRYSNWGLSDKIDNLLIFPINLQSARYNVSDQNIVNCFWTPYHFHRDSRLKWYSVQKQHTINVNKILSKTFKAKISVPVRPSLALQDVYSAHLSGNWQHLVTNQVLLCHICRPQESKGKYSLKFTACREREVWCSLTRKIWNLKWHCKKASHRKRLEYQC